MTFRKHIRFLFEMFLPEARFPDEKFWDREGDPIQGPRKSSGAGAAGTTAKDWGVEDDAPDLGPDDDTMTTTSKDLHNHFSKTLHEFERNIYGASRKLYGKDFDSVIEKAWGKPGMVRDGVRKMWDNNFTDHEGVGEIGFLFDVAQNGNSGYGGFGPSTYPDKNISWSYPKEDYDDQIQDMVPRKSRPKGVKGQKLVY